MDKINRNSPPSGGDKPAASTTPAAPTPNKPAGGPAAPAPTSGFRPQGGGFRPSGPPRFGNSGGEGWRGRGGNDKNRTRINFQITALKVRVIGPAGEQLGIMRTDEAVRMAKEQYDLDLVEVSPLATPPVCKVLDFGKHKYQLKKKAQEAKRNQTVMVVKEVKFRPQTDTHDFNFKVKHVERFLAEGNKAKVSVFFRGREMAYTQLGRELLQKVSALVQDIGSVEQEPLMEGRYMSIILAPKSVKGQTKNAKNEDE